MRKRLIVLVLATLALLLTLLFLFGERSPFGSSNSSFAIDQVDNIKSIEIIENDHMLELALLDKGWMVNKTFAARETAIDFILTTLENIEIKSPVSDELYNMLVEKEDIQPVKVIIRAKGRADSYYIYRTNNPEYASILRRSLKSKPFFVYLPGYDFDPGIHFVTDEKFWMPYHIFNLNPETISRISLEYYDPSMADLEIIVEKEEIHLLASGLKIAAVSQEKLKRYISYYTYVPFENWAFTLDDSIKADLLNSIPEILINVELEEDKLLSLRLWNKFIYTEAGIIPDTDRLYGSLNYGQDFFIARYFDIDPLIKSVEYFKSD